MYSAYKFDFCKYNDSIKELKYYLHYVQIDDQLIELF